MGNHHILCTCISFDSGVCVGCIGQRDANSESMLPIEQNGAYRLHVCLVGEFPVGCIRPFVLMATHEFLQGFLRLPIPVPPKCDSGKMKHVISVLTNRRPQMDARDGLVRGRGDRGRGDRLA